MANEQHPGPWRWNTHSDGIVATTTIKDANGEVVLSAAPGIVEGLPYLKIASARARTLIAAAPEMATLLRWALSVIENYGEDEGYWPRAASRDGDERIDPTERMKSIADLLARIDEAGK